MHTFSSLWELQSFLELDFKLEAWEGWKQGIPVAENKHQLHTTGTYNLFGTSLYFNTENKKLRNRIWNKNPMMHLIPNAILSEYFDWRTLP